MIQKNLRKNFKTGIYSGLFATAVATYFFSFLTVVQIGATRLKLTGFDLTFGTELTDGFGMPIVYQPDLWLGMAFFLTICGFVCSLLRLPGRNLQILLMSITAFLCLLLFLIATEYRTASQTSYHFALAFGLLVLIFGSLVCIGHTERFFRAASLTTDSEAKRLTINIITKTARDAEGV